MVKFLEHTFQKRLQSRVDFMVMDKRTLNLYRFLFRHKNDGIKAYLSTGQNEHYILSENEKQKSLSIGASNGKFGLWVDQDLNNGTSEFCSTFNNEPLCLDGKFQISALEIWRIKF